MAWTLGADGQTLVWQGGGPAPAVPWGDQPALRRAIQQGGPQPGPASQQPNMVFVGSPGPNTPTVPYDVAAAAGLLPTPGGLPERTIDTALLNLPSIGATLTPADITALYQSVDPTKVGDIQRIIGALGPQFTLGQFLAQSNLGGLSKHSLQDYLQIAANLTQQPLTSQQLSLPKPKQHGLNWLSQLVEGAITGGFGGSLMPGILPAGPFEGTARMALQSQPGQIINMLATKVALPLVGAFFGSALGPVGTLGGGALGSQLGKSINFKPSGGTVGAVTPTGAGLPAPAGSFDAGTGGGGGVSPGINIPTPSVPQAIPTGEAAGVTPLGPPTQTLDDILGLLSAPNLLNPTTFNALVSLAGRLPTGVPTPTQPATPSAIPPAPAPFPIPPGINANPNVILPGNQAYGTTPMLPATATAPVPALPGTSTRTSSLTNSGGITPSPIFSGSSK